MQHFLEWRGERVPLEPGASRTFGRGTACDIVLPADDLLVSRRAGAVHVHEEHVEVVNTSSSQDLRLRPPVGADVAVRAGGSATSRGMPVFTILLLGEHGAAYEITCRGPGVAAVEQVDSGLSTRVRPFELTPTERRMIQALCAPLLLRNGTAARPATYAEIAQTLGGSDGHVRNVLRGVRDRLTEHGVPGLTAVGRGGAADFRQPLCDLAIANGWAYGE